MRAAAQRVWAGGRAGARTGDESQRQRTCHAHAAQGPGHDVPVPYLQPRSHGPVQQPCGGQCKGDEATSAVRHMQSVVFGAWKQRARATVMRRESERSTVALVEIVVK